MSVEILKMRVKAMLHVRLWQQVYDLCYRMRDYSSKRAAVWKELRVPVTGFQPPNMTIKEDKGCCWSRENGSGKHDDVKVWTR